MNPLKIKSTHIAESAIVCDLQGGGTWSLRFLGANLARVTVKPATGYKEPKTWAIAPLKTPIAAPLNTPIAGKQHTADVPWTGRDRDDIAAFDLPKVDIAITSHSVGSHSYVLNTEQLSVEIDATPQSSLCVRWKTKAGQLFLSDRSTSAYLVEARTGIVRHCLQRETTDKYYGLGDKTGELNLHGRRLRTIALDSIGYDAKSGDPLYKHWPFVLSRHVTETGDTVWCGIYYDTLAACTFDLGQEHDNYHGLYRSVDIDDGDLDYYLMVGDTPAAVIAQFVRLIGGTHLPPQWTLGFAQTAMGLADAPDAQTQLDQFIDKIKAHDIPIAAFHYGSGYSSRGKQRYVFTWNRDKFPDPKTLNAKFNARGMRLVANIKPCLLDDHPAYAEIAAAGGFINNDATQTPIIEPYWDGQGSHIDFTNPVAVAWWQAQLQAQVLDFGIDVGWNDNNEYSIMDDDAVCFNGTPMHRARPLHALLMTRATFEAQAEYAKNKAAVLENFTVSRAGPPGIQRYAQTWSGDNTTSWHTLRWNVRTGLQMSLSGMFNIGHDVGGFYGPVPDAELFVRWVQACALNPRMVMNSWKAGNVSNVPWMHAEVTPLVRDAIRLRHTLLPYLWTLFERASAHQDPIIRPTFYDFPDDITCFADCDEFMVGANLLFAPVLQAGQTQRSVYLPKLPNGELWRDYFTNAEFAGGQMHTVAVTLASMPLFVRGDMRVDSAVLCAGNSNIK